MAKLIMYLLEASAILACFYLFYILVLRRETFFNLNRFFLITILLLSLLFPLVSFDFNAEKAIPIEQPIQEISKLRLSYYEAMALWEYNAYNSAALVEKKGVESISHAKSVNWIKLSFITLFIIYCIGIIVCLSRTFWTLQWIRRMIVSNSQIKIDGVNVIKHPDPIAPFSFFRYVFVYDKMVDTPEFNHVLAHERIHIQQRHSIDLVFVQFLAAVFWFNPVIWQLFKSLKTTHEYIADKKIISSGYSLVEYQTLLLKQLISNNSHGLVHNFNLSFIKNRITMMQNKKS
jgi:beta-lactamase regulating signal transducer with metallopeptidase domain